MTKLSERSLTHVSDHVKVPGYDRRRVRAGIVHVGIGNFYRAHEAWYTDEILHLDHWKWGICGIGILGSDSRMHDVLQSQDGLYTLMVKNPSGEVLPRIIGSVVGTLLGPEDPNRVVETMADADVKVVSLTITEGGYNYDETTGRFDWSNPDIRWDQRNPARPRTIFGYLTRVIKIRMERGLPGFTLLSCDNIQHNGDMCRDMLLTFVEETEPGLTAWIHRHITFPNSMVDRITPVTTPSDIEMLNDRYGIEDQWPVVCEPFVQWVIEDRFSNGRPPWELAGAEFVGDVAPYEKAKIRLLNAGHTLLGMIGSIMGYRTIHESVADPLIENLLRRFMDEEVTPLLGDIPKLNLTDYKNSLIERFANPFIKDQLSRICSESSSKIPKFLLPTITGQLDRGGPVSIGTLVIAAWCFYSAHAGEPGYAYEINDRLKDTLRIHAVNSVSNDRTAFIKIGAVFGDLAQSKRFVDLFCKFLDLILASGVRSAAGEALGSWFTK